MKMYTQNNPTIHFNEIVGGNELEIFRCHVKDVIASTYCNKKKNFFLLF